MTVVGIDPGRHKCGLALCAPGRVLARTIVPPAEVLGTVLRWAAEHPIDAIVIGGGTGSGQMIATLAGLVASGRLPPPVVQEERDTTLAARRRYFQDHPPHGWRRIVPRSLQVPPEPYDDYAAIIIAERRFPPS